MLGWFKWLGGRPQTPRSEAELALWRQALAAVPSLHGLSDTEQTTLIGLGQQLLKRKTLTLIGVELSPRQQAVLALQAALPEHWRVVDRGNERELRHGRTSAIRIRYATMPPWDGAVRLDNRVEGYRLDIDTVADAREPG